MYLENEVLYNSEKEYLTSLIHYLPLYGDPRGRGNYSTQYVNIILWKLSLIAHHYKKPIDAEFSEEMLDAVLLNLEEAILRVPEAAREENSILNFGFTHKTIAFKTKFGYRDQNQI